MAVSSPVWRRRGGTWAAASCRLRHGAPDSLAIAAVFSVRRHLWRGAVLLVGSPAGSRPAGDDPGVRGGTSGAQPGHSARSDLVCSRGVSAGADPGRDDASVSRRQPGQPDRQPHQRDPRSRRADRSGRHREHPRTFGARADEGARAPAGVGHVARSGEVDGAPRVGDSRAARCRRRGGRRLLLAWAMQHSLVNQGFTLLRVPVTTLAVYLVVAAACGVVAGILPARTSRGLDILAAISTA